MAPRRLTLDDALADFHSLYVLDERTGKLRTSDEYQRRFPGFEDVVRAEYAFLRGDVGAAPVELPRAESWTPSDAGLECGRDIGPYRLVRMLGRGAQGTVYLAKHRQLGRFVALKVLANTWLFSAAHRARFVREARAAARLEHESICSVHDFGCEQDIDFIAMQYVEGETLHRSLLNASERSSREVAPGSDVAAHAPDSNGLPLRPSSREELGVLLQFFERIAEALQAAHDAGIVHRDVKPGNIMVTPALRPVVLDFGLVRDDQGDPDHATRTGDLIGTRGYIAPEQLRGERDVDARADVYALGVVLYECLTLALPYPQPTWESLRHALEHAALANVRSLNPHVPRDVALIVQTALETNRERRYRSARDLAEDLRRARQGVPLLAEPPSWPDRGARWVQRHARAIVKVTAAASLAGLVGSLLWVASLRAERNRTSAREHLDARRAQLAVAMQHALEPSYVAFDSSRIDLRARVRAYVASLRLGDVDLERLGANEATLAPAGTELACEPDKIARTSWMAFQVVEDVDALLATASAELPAPPDTETESDARELARVRAGAARFLSTHLPSTAALVWRTYESKDRGIPDAVRRAVLASNDTLARVMLSHVAWDRGDRRLAGDCLAKDAIWSEDGALQRLAFLERGSVQLGAGELADAQDSFELSRANAPRPNVFDHLNMARVAAARDDPLGAETHLRAGLALEPDNVVILTSLASVLARREDYAAALETARDAVDADPHYAAAHLELGRALIDTRNVRDGLDELNQALERSQHDSTMEDAVEIALDGATDDAELDREVVELLRTIEPSAFWLGVRAHIQLGMGHLGEVLELTGAGLALEPEHRSCMLWRANACWRGVDAATGLALFDRIVALYPQNVDVRRFRARCLELMDRGHEAIDASFDVLDRRGTSPQELLPLVLSKGSVDAKRRLADAFERENADVPVALAVGAAPRAQAVRQLRSAMWAACDARADVEEAQSATLRVARVGEFCVTVGELAVAAQRADRAEGEALDALAAGFDRADAHAFFQDSRSDVESLPCDSVRSLARAYVALAIGNHREAVDGFTDWLRVPTRRVEAVDRVVRLLLRAGHSARVAATMDKWDLDAREALAPIVAQVDLAEGRIDDAVLDIADAPSSLARTLVLAECALAKDRPEDASECLSRLPCYQLVRPDVSNLRARVQASLAEVRAPASDGDSAHEVGGFRDRDELNRACDAGRALSLARACMRPAFPCRAPATNTAGDGALRGPELAMERALDWLELHLARCQALLGSAEIDGHERCARELASVLTEPGFARLRDVNDRTSCASRAASYFDAVRETLGSALYSH